MSAPARRSVCVFAAASAGDDPSWAEAAAELGTALAERGVRLVYGGGAVGLMGATADAAMAAGGEVVGILPAFLDDRELGHPGISELRVVASMHERKQTMADLSEAFIALPGGLGTLEELVEVATWSQLRIHAKPVVLLDVGGFWAPLWTLLEQFRDRGLLHAPLDETVRRAAGVDEALELALG